MGRKHILHMHRDRSVKYRSVYNLDETRVAGTHQNNSTADLVAPTLVPLVVEHALVRRQCDDYA